MLMFYDFWILLWAMFCSFGRQYLCSVCPENQINFPVPLVEISTLDKSQFSECIDLLLPLYIEKTGQAAHYSPQRSEHLVEALTVQSAQSPPGLLTITMMPYGCHPSPAPRYTLAYTHPTAGRWLIQLPFRLLAQALVSGCTYDTGSLCDWDGLKPC